MKENLLSCRLEVRVSIAKCLQSFLIERHGKSSLKIINSVYIFRKNYINYAVVVALYKFGGSPVRYVKEAIFLYVDVTNSLF